MKLKRKKDSGFTLIELMIVIAVIGILAVVLVPKIGGFKDSAKTTGTLTNQKSMEAFVVVNYEKWLRKSPALSASDVASEIATQLAKPDNTLTNPFSGKTTVITLSGTVAGATTDAVQLKTDATTPKYGKGVLVVDLSSWDTAGIKLTCYDGTASTNTVGEEITIKP
jgi:type IV pilus assembly protein PilA